MMKIADRRHCCNHVPILYTLRLMKRKYVLTNGSLTKLKSE